jgi:hypothetical protein
MYVDELWAHFLGYEIHVVKYIVPDRGNTEMNKQGPFDTRL